MRGADRSCSVVQFCNYLKTTLSQHLHSSVASISNASFNSFLPYLNFIGASLKADSGASKNFVREKDAPALLNVKPLRNGPVAKLPNNETIQPNAKGELPFSTYLSPTAKESIIYPALKNASLLSIGQLCDDDCIALFHKKIVDC